MFVRIKIKTVGVNFGTSGVLVARNGRVMATTGMYPYGFTASAYDAAVCLAECRGWTVS